MPSEKNSCSASELMLTNGSTAMDFSSSSTTDTSSTATASAGSGPLLSRSTSSKVTATTSVAMIMKFSLRPVSLTTDWERSTSDSLLSPSGVISKAHEKINAGTSPIARMTKMSLGDHSGNSRMGTTTSTICSNTQEATPYAIPTRMTLRRLSSVKIVIVLPRHWHFEHRKNCDTCLFLVGYRAIARPAVCTWRYP